DLARGNYQQQLLYYKQQLVSQSAGLAFATDAEERARRYQQLVNQVATLESLVAAYQKKVPAAESDVQATRKSYEQASAVAKKSSDALDAAKAKLRDARQAEAAIFKTLKDRLETDNTAVAARDKV